jgi:hypothetical protein
MKKISGACGCGAVSFSAEGIINGVVSCHCKFCQRLHGNYNPMVLVEKSDFSLQNDAGLAWFDSSSEARRGFCKFCGAALFKEQKTGSKILISIGSLNDTNEWDNTKNVFTEEAGKYYPMPKETS